LISTASRLTTLRRLAAELQATGPTREREALLADVRDRIAELSGATYESSAWRRRPAEVALDDGRSRPIAFFA